MTFATAERGSFRVSVGNTLDSLTATEINQAMDTIVAAIGFVNIPSKKIATIKQG